MSRPRGELPYSEIDKRWPHQVEIIVPPFGLGQKANAMGAWCNGKAHAKRGANRVEGNQVIDACRYCFASAEDAEAFHLEFGGEVISP